MQNNEELIKNTNIEEIAKKGSEVYAKIKSQYEPGDNGSFLAIEVNSGQVYKASTSSEAVELARKAHPDTVFYVVKIGHSVAEMLASMGLYARGVYS